MVGRWCALGVAVALAVGATACGGGGGEAAPAPTDPTSTTMAAPPPTVLTDEQAVLAAYQGYWDTWLAANDPPNPDHPDLARYYAGPSLERAVQSISDRAEVGQALRLPPGAKYSHRSTVVSLAGDHATVSDCAIDDGMVVGASDGFVLDNSVATRRLTASLVRDGALWRVWNVTTEATWEGVAGCAG